MKQIKVNFHPISILNETKLNWTKLYKTRSIHKFKGTSAKKRFTLFEKFLNYRVLYANELTFCCIVSDNNEESSIFSKASIEVKFGNFGVINPILSSD